MNIENFVVRPKRRLIERYADPGSWIRLSVEALSELSHEVAGLPSELEPEAEEAKRFDLLVLNLQLALLRSELAFERLRDQVKAIAGLLEEKSAIPMVRDQMALIQDVQTDQWWQDVTIPMLEFGLGLFVRSLVGMDREVAKSALAGFLTGKALSANQIEFVNLIVNHLTEHGVMEPALLYESPFTDITPRGPDNLFSTAQIDQLMGVLDGVRATAVAG